MEVLISPLNVTSLFISCAGTRIRYGGSVFEVALSDVLKGTPTTVFTERLTLVRDTIRYGLRLYCSAPIVSGGGGTSTQYISPCLISRISIGRLASMVIRPAHATNRTLIRAPAGHPRHPMWAERCHHSLNRTADPRPA